MLRMSDGEVPEWMQILGEEMIEEGGELKKEILPEEYRNRKWVLYDKEKSATEWSYEKILSHRRLNKREQRKWRTKIGFVFNILYCGGNGREEEFPMEKLCYERRSYAHLRFYIRNNLGENEQKQTLRAAVGSLGNKSACKRWSQGL